MAQAEVAILVTPSIENLLCGDHRAVLWDLTRPETAAVDRHNDVAA